MTYTYFYETTGMGWLFVSLAWYIFILIAGWKLFEKAGEPGWKSLIPIYGSYILYKISWKTSMFWVYLACVVVSGFMGASENSMLVTVGSLLSLASFILMIIQTHKLSKAFEHGAGYTIGLLLLRPVFILILGFGSAAYKGNPDINRQTS